MNLRHEAILSLNTRIRRLRYLYQAIHIVGDTAIAHALAVQELVDYGCSRKVYDEIRCSADEPFSGHLFENAAWSFEKNSERLARRSKDSVARVAVSYFDFACQLGLIVEHERRLVPSQLSLPLRYLESGMTPSNGRMTRVRRDLTLALLLKFDRDLTAPFLDVLLRSSNGVSLSEVSENWGEWVNNWLEKLIEAASARSLGNPAELMRYKMTLSTGRANPKRYAEHIALIRFHWFIDLGLAMGSPNTTPTSFVPKGRSDPLVRFLGQPATAIVDGSLAEIYYAVTAARLTRTNEGSELPIFASTIRGFLAAARQRGMSNVRLSLIDMLWISVSGADTLAGSDFGSLTEEIDRLLKHEGLLVIKAPQREESYVPTQQ